MENVSIPSPATTQPLSGVAAPRTETQQAEVQQQRVIETHNTQDKPLDGKDQDQARFDAVKKAATKIISTNPFSNSVARFTIYRDIDASLTTRFTNLSDGKVTFVSEPELFTRTSGNLLDGTV